MCLGGSQLQSMQIGMRPSVKLYEFSWFAVVSARRQKVSYMTNSMPKQPGLEKRLRRVSVDNQL